LKATRKRSGSLEKRRRCFYR